MENKEIANDDAKKLSLVVVFMSIVVFVLFGVIPMVWEASFVFLKNYCYFIKHNKNGDHYGRRFLLVTG